MARSQVPNTHGWVHYTVDDGLPSNHVYQALCNTDGQMWFATDAGLARHDGTRVHTYTKADGMPSNDVYRLVSNGEGRIWCRPYGRPFYWEDGEFHSIQEIHRFRWENCSVAAKGDTTVVYNPLYPDDPFRSTFF